MKEKKQLYVSIILYILTGILFTTILVTIKNNISPNENYNDEYIPFIEEPISTTTTTTTRNITTTAHITTTTTQKKKTTTQKIRAVDKLDQHLYNIGYNLFDVSTQTRYYYDDTNNVQMIKGFDYENRSWVVYSQHPDGSTGLLSYDIKTKITSFTGTVPGETMYATLDKNNLYSCTGGGCLNDWKTILQNHKDEFLQILRNAGVKENEL